MYNLNLSPSARLLFYLIDDLSGDDAQTWTRWQKMALCLGLSHTAFFQRVAELKDAGLLTQEREGNRIYYKMQTVPKSGMAAGSVLISDPDHYPVTLPAIAEELETPTPNCFRCRDTGREILGKRGLCRCEAGTQIRRTA